MLQLAIAILVLHSTHALGKVHHTEMVWHLKSDIAHHEPGRLMLEQPKSPAQQSAASCADRQCQISNSDPSIADYGTYVPGFLPYGVKPSCPAKIAQDGQQCGAKIAKCAPVSRCWQLFS